MKGTTARCSDQTVLQKEMINTILGDRTANQVGHGFQPLGGVFHSNAGTHRFQQFNVVVAITECHGVFLAEPKMGKYLTDAGAFAAQMSGSGPAVFGLFEREQQAQAAASLLQARRMQAFVCKFE